MTYHFHLQLLRFLFHLPLLLTLRQVNDHNQILLLCLRHFPAQRKMCVQKTQTLQYQKEALVLVVAAFVLDSNKCSNNNGMLNIQIPLSEPCHYETHIVCRLMHIDCLAHHQSSTPPAYRDSYDLLAEWVVA